MTELAQVLRHVPRDAGDPNVLVGLDSPDDSAVYRISSDQAIVQSVDFFTPIVDDPFDWGRIAAANALSDIYAMGGRPIVALNLVGWPRSLDMALLGRVLEGAADVCGQAGVSVLGGHSVDDPEPKFGLAVTGVVHPDRIIYKTGAQPGDDLILTKPLGSGVISTAIKESKAQPGWIKEAVDWMTTLNASAAAGMTEIGVNAATDVTGFGLMGHLLEMLDDKQGAEIDFTALSFLPGAPELADAGVLPGGSRRNLEAVREMVDAGDLKGGGLALLFDAQTSGGLLIAVDQTRSDDLLEALQEREVSGASRIGRIAGEPGRVRVLNA